MYTLQETGSGSQGGGREGGHRRPSDIGGLLHKDEREAGRATAGHDGLLRRRVRAGRRRGRSAERERIRRRRR